MKAKPELFSPLIITKSEVYYLFQRILIANEPIENDYNGARIMMKKWNKVTMI